MVQSRLWLMTSLTLFLASGISPGQQAQRSFPSSERLKYSVDWRLITAGAAEVELTRQGADLWQTKLTIESAGLVSRLYRVFDKYQAIADSHFCGKSVSFDAQEGKKHNVGQILFDSNQHKLDYDDRDLVKNKTDKRTMEIPACTYDITGAFASLRLTSIEPGKSTTIPISDGKKLAQAKLESQAHETLSIEGKTYSTTRYEAYLFDNILYRRKGRLQIWLTDDTEHLPVQLRLQMGFPIGTVTIQLTDHQNL